MGPDKEFWLSQTLVRLWNFLLVPSVTFLVKSTFSQKYRTVEDGMDTELHSGEEYAIQ